MRLGRRLLGYRFYLLGLLNVALQVNHEIGSVMKVLAGVMNPIAYDGRVHRATKVLAEVAEIELICPAGADVSPDLPYAVRTVDLPKGLGARFTEHPVFWWAFVRAALRFRPDVVYVHDHYLAPAGTLAARLVGARLVYDAHELSIPEPGVRMAWQDRAKYLFDLIGVRFADVIITTGNERARAMQRHYRLSVEPLVIRNIAEKEMTEKRSRASDRATLRAGAECLFVYEGHVTLERGIQDFVEAMQFLPESCHFLIVGGGPHITDLQALAASLGLAERVRFTGRVTREAVQDILLHCDIGLVSYSWQGLNNLYCTPNKIFEYAHAGLPMVTTAQPSLRDFVVEEGIGSIVERNFTPREVADVMQDAFRTRKQLAARLPAFVSAYSWEKEGKRLRRAIANLVEAGSGRA